MMVLGVLSAGCGGDAAPPGGRGGQTPVASPGSPSGTSSPSPTPPPGTAGDLGSARIRLVKMATLDQPVAMAAARDGTIYFAEKTGQVRAMRGGRLGEEPVLSLRVSLGSEQGLLGLALSPDENFLYVNFTDVRGDTHITEFRLRDGRPDPGSVRDVLFVDQPYPNHNGGQILFGPDEMLYIALGDGGSGGDPHGNGQSLRTVLGKLLRIDPRPSGGRPYRVPSDNPFVGAEAARPEIWAYGLRNPWRFTFDRQTGDIWIGDVGEGLWEEIDYRRASSSGGENYGWDRLEGRDPFEGDPPDDAVPPLFAYLHDDGACAVTGGYVYRGEDIPALSGAYLYGDFCIGSIMALKQRGGRVVQRRALGAVVENLSSFGQDLDGELYAMSLYGDVYRIEG